MVASFSFATAPSAIFEDVTELGPNFAEVTANLSIFAVVTALSAIFVVVTPSSAREIVAVAVVPPDTDIGAVPFTSVTPDEVTKFVSFVN